MSITITAIIEAVNEAIKTTESSGALSARMRISLNQALRWLSKQKKWSFLHKKDATQTLASADQALDYPSDFRVEDKITLNDGTYEGPPLKLLDGGFDAWLSHREDETTAQYDEPQYYVKRGARRRG